MHLILVPDTKDGLNLAVGEAHRRYTRGSIFVKVGGSPYILAGVVYKLGYIITRPYEPIQ